MLELGALFGAEVHFNNFLQPVTTNNARDPREDVMNAILAVQVSRRNDYALFIVQDGLAQPGCGRPDAVEGGPLLSNNCATLVLNVFFDFMQAVAHQWMQGYRRLAGGLGVEEFIDYIESL